MTTIPSMNAANAVGQAGLANAASAIGLGGMLGPLTTTSTYPYEPKRTHSSSKVVLSAKVEVVKVANGYLVNIGRTEGYEYETHVAATPEEVNNIILSQMVAFRLEDGN